MYINVSKVSKAKTLSLTNTTEQEKNHTTPGAVIVESSFRGLKTLSDMYGGTFFDNK